MDSSVLCRWKCLISPQCFLPMLPPAAFPLPLCLHCCFPFFQPPAPLCIQLLCALPASHQDNCKPCALPGSHRDNSVLGPTESQTVCLALAYTTPWASGSQEKVSTPWMPQSLHSLDCDWWWDSACVGTFCADQTMNGSQGIWYHMKSTVTVYLYTVCADTAVRGRRAG
jgi:hypothetical protein